MLKKISTMARIDCEKFMGTKVFLTTWVKVKRKLAGQRFPHPEFRISGYMIFPGIVR